MATSYRRLIRLWQTDGPEAREHRYPHHRRCSPRGYGYASILGDNAGSYIYASANGLGSTNVSGSYDEAKSYSNETTLSSDLTADSYDKDIIPVLKYLCSKVSARLKKDHVYGRTVTVSVKTGNFKRHSAQLQLDNSIDDENILFTHAKTLSDKLLLGTSGLFARGEVIRLVGVGVTKLDDGSYRQMSLFDMMNEKTAVPTIDSSKMKKLDAMKEKLTSTYGKGIIKKASELPYPQEDPRQK